MRAMDYRSFAMVVGIERLVQREGQARQGCLSVCAQRLCKDAKPTKHTQTLALRKARCDSLNAKPYKHIQTIAVRKASVIVRFCKG